MAMQLGDKVRFLNQEGGGVITKLLPNGQVLVMIEEGFELPVLASEVVLDVSLSADTSKKGNEIHGNATLPEYQSISNTARGICYVLAVPGNLDATQWKLYLANETKQALHWASYIEYENRWEAISSGILRSGSSQVLQELDSTALVNLKNLKVLGFLFEKGGTEFYNPYEVLVSKKILSRNMLHLIKKETGLGQSGHFLKLGAAANTWTEKDEVLDLRELVREKSTVVNKDVKEVDLHIEALTENYKKLNATEMLRIQLNEARKQIEECMFGKYKRLVLIHGVGAGVLKQEVIKLIKEYGFAYSDASLLRYGSGATEIYIK